MTKTNPISDVDPAVRAVRLQSLLSIYSGGGDPRVYLDDAGELLRSLGFPLTDAQAKDLFVAVGTVGGRNTAKLCELAQVAERHVEKLASRGRTKAKNAAKARAARAAKREAEAA